MSEQRPELSRIRETIARHERCARSMVHISVMPDFWRREAEDFEELMRIIDSLQDDLR